MKLLLTTLLLYCGAVLQAQNITLSKKISSVTDVGDQVSGLAGNVLKVYQAEDPFDRLDITVRLQMAAGLYQEALHSMDSIQQYMGISSDSSVAAVFIHYRCFAVAKLQPMSPDADFATHFTGILSAIYQQLPEAAKPITDQFFLQDTAVYFKELNSLVEACRGKEQVDISSAILLIRNWFALQLMRRIQEPARAFFVAEEQRKYFIIDSLLTTHEGKVEIPVLIVRSRTNRGPVPAVVMHNIYASSSDKSKAKEAADKGYAGVIINPRGKRNSKNSIEPFEHDGEDIYGVLDWISAQAWFNGRAGMYGGSYLGFSQWAATKKLHPALKTIVPQVAVGFGIDFPKFNGIFYGYMLRWLHAVTNNPLTDLPEFNNEDKWKQLYMKWFTSGLPFRKLDSLEGRPMPLFQRWLDHPAFDGYWKAAIPVENDFRRIDIPVLTTTGYFDDDQPGALYYYREHMKRNPAAAHYLYIGPFDHSGAQGMPTSQVLGYTIDSIAQVSINSLVWEWFNYTLRGGTRPSALLDKITYQPMGTNQWKGAKDMRSLSNDSIIFYLSHQYTRQGFLLQKTTPVHASWLEQVIDLTERPLDDFTIQARSKTPPPSRENIIFASLPLDRDRLMNGVMEGSVECILNKKDADMLFELYELTADSAYHLLSYTTQRLSYILHPAKRTLLVPGKTYQIPICNSSFTSRRIAKGSRLVLYAGPLKDFNFQVNYGTGKPVSEESMADAAEPLRIKWSSRSFIKVPLLR